MGILQKISGPAPVVLLLAALLAAGARAYTVTTAECKKPGRLWPRVRQDPVDSGATELRMGECHLTEMHPNMLSGLPNVNWITLWNNNIENIDLAVLHAVPELGTLLLSGNKLRELPVFDKRACSKLYWLNLGSNQLTEVNAETFSACTQLRVLYLDDNHIKFIHHSVFTALTNLNYLTLAGNKIRFIPDQMFSNNGKLEKLYLDGNRISHLPTDFASRLKRAGASLIDFHFYDNPWHCACLIELLADVRRSGMRKCNNSYHKFPYDGTAPVCEYTDAAPCCRGSPTGMLRAARGR